MNIQIIEEKLNKLPEKLQEKALAFIEFLINKSRKENKNDSGEITLVQNRN